MVINITEKNIAGKENSDCCGWVGEGRGVGDIFSLVRPHYEVMLKKV